MERISRYGDVPSSAQLETIFKHQEILLNKGLRKKPPFKPFPGDLIAIEMLKVDKMVVFEMVPESGWPITDLMPSILVYLDSQNNALWLNTLSHAPFLIALKERQSHAGEVLKIESGANEARTFNRFLKSLAGDTSKSLTKEDIGVLWVMLAYHDSIMQYPQVVITTCDKEKRTLRWDNATKGEKTLLGHGDELLPSQVGVLVKDNADGRYSVVVVNVDAKMTRVTSARLERHIGDGISSQP